MLRNMHVRIQNFRQAYTVQPFPGEIVVFLQEFQQFPVRILQQSRTYLQFFFFFHSQYSSRFYTTGAGLPAGLTGSGIYSGNFIGLFAHENDHGSRLSLVHISQFLCRSRQDTFPVDAVLFSQHFGDRIHTFLFQFLF